VCSALVGGGEGWGNQRGKDTDHSERTPVDCSTRREMRDRSILIGDGETVSVVSDEWQMAATYDMMRLTNALSARYNGAVPLRHDTHGTITLATGTRYRISHYELPDMTYIFCSKVTIANTNIE